MLGDLDVPTALTLGEGNDPVRASLRDEPGAVEQRLDSRRRVVGRCEDLYPHTATLVEPAPQEARLLEHPDQDAWIAVRDEGGQLLRLDGSAGVAERPVDGPKLGGSGDVRDGEADASLGPESSTVSLGSPSLPARPTICT